MKPSARIYMDYAAATPLDPRVQKVMEPYWDGPEGFHFGNPSSIHQWGQTARKAIDEARLKCMELLGAFSVHEMVFTGSGTESCNTAIFGAAFARAPRGKHIVVSAMEHPAVLEPARYLRDNFGFELTEVAPDKEGIVKPAAIEAALRPDTILISVMLINNEVGSIQPVAAIAKLARERGILMHTDACQAPGFTSIRVDELNVDLLSLNGSKIYGPKGVGLLYIREGVQITPLIFGGGQEFRIRGGTENPALIVGFATALELVLKDAPAETPRLQKLRDQLIDGLEKLPGVTVNGSRTERSANNVNIHVPGHLGETLVMRLDLDGLAASSGSACSSGKTEPSHVLLAMGQPQQKALESLRLTLGRFTKPADIKIALKSLSTIVSAD